MKGSCTSAASLSMPPQVAEVLATNSLCTVLQPQLLKMANLANHRVICHRTRFSHSSQGSPSEAGSMSFILLISLIAGPPSLCKCKTCTSAIVLQHIRPLWCSRGWWGSATLEGHDLKQVKDLGCGGTVRSNSLCKHPTLPQCTMGRLRAKGRPIHGEIWGQRACKESQCGPAKCHQGESSHWFTL